MTSLCRCGHDREAHDHYRVGSECVGRVPREAVDGRPWSRPCDCTRWRWARWPEALGIAAFAALILLIIVVANALGVDR